MVPSSITVQILEATCSPISPENADVFFLLKSPSKPWPMASCIKTPGHPEPRTTVISPAGASMASRFNRA